MTENYTEGEDVNTVETENYTENEDVSTVERSANLGTDDDQMMVDDEIIMDHKSSFCTMRRFKIAMAISILILILIPIIVLGVSGPKLEASMGTIWLPVGPLQRPVDLDVDGMGESVALSGSGLDLAIGSHKAQNDKGRVDIIRWVGTRWGQLGKVLVGDVEGENFGQCVQLSRNGRVVLASGYGSNTADASDALKGKVRAYRLDQTEEGYWIQLGNDVVGDQIGDRFGIALSMNSDGTAFIVGADGNDDDDPRNGYAVVYELSNDGNKLWEERRRFGGEFGSRMGYAVAMSGDGSTVCIGERDYRVLGEALSRGRVTCWHGPQWKDRKGVELAGHFAGGSFGYSLSLNDSGNVLAVGDRLAGEKDEGSVAVYQFKNNHWKEFQRQFSGTGSDQGGYKVALNAKGNVLAWTARGYDFESKNDIGVVRVAHLQFENNQWSQLGEEIAGDQEGDWFGESVALSDDGTIVTASSNKVEGGEYIKTYKLE